MPQHQQELALQTKQSGTVPPSRSPATHQQIQPMQVQPLPQQQQQQQQQRRERADSLSDVSSLGDARALITDEDLHFALLMPNSNNNSNKREPAIPENEPVPNQPVLGKFIPVTVSKKPAKPTVQGRIYHPPGDPTQQQQQQLQQVPVPSVYMQQRATNSFEIPQNFLAPSSNNDGQTDSFTQHALAALAATAVAAAQGWGAAAATATPPLTQEQQHPSSTNTVESATRVSVGPTTTTTSRKQLPQRPPLKSFSTVTRRRKSYKHPTKKKMLKKLYKVLTEIGLKKEDFERDARKQSSLANFVEQRNRRSTTSKATVENDDASMVSSLSSSSSSSLESDAGVATTTTTKLTPVSQLLPVAQDGLVSPANTGSASNSYQTKEENEQDWMFHHNPIPRNVRLKVFPGDGEEDDNDHDDDDDADYNSWCSKNSTSTEQKWGIIKQQQQQQQQQGSSR